MTDTQTQPAATDTSTRVTSHVTAIADGTSAVVTAVATREFVDGLCQYLTQAGLTVLSRVDESGPR